MVLPCMQALTAACALAQCPVVKEVSLGCQEAPTDLPVVLLVTEEGTPPTGCSSALAGAAGPSAPGSMEEAGGQYLDGRSR